VNACSVKPTEIVNAIGTVPSFITTLPFTPPSGCSVIRRSFVPVSAVMPSVAPRRPRLAACERIAVIW